YSHIQCPQPAPNLRPAGAGAKTPAFQVRVFAMKFSLRHDSDLPADQLFRAVSDFDRIERMLARRGIEARRGEVVAPALGAAWDIGFDLRGKRRELQLELVEFAAPERIAMTGVG